VTTSPVLIPIRNPIEVPKSRSSSSVSVRNSSRTSPAARTARSGSSSCRTGTPKTAITASPMNFSTLPRWRSTTSRTVSKKRPSTRRALSASNRSPSSVEPTTSQKRTVTVFRSSRGSSPAGAPQSGQNLNGSAAMCPQAAQRGMSRVYAPSCREKTRLRGHFWSGAAYCREHEVRQVHRSVLTGVRTGRFHDGAPGLFHDLRRTVGHQRADRGRDLLHEASELFRRVPVPPDLELLDLHVRKTAALEETADRFRRRPGQRPRRPGRRRRHA